MEIEMRFHSSSLFHVRKREVYTKKPDTSLRCWESTWIEQLVDVSWTHYTCTSVPVNSQCDHRPYTQVSWIAETWRPKISPLRSCFNHNLPSATSELSMLIIEFTEFRLKPWSPEIDTKLGSLGPGSRHMESTIPREVPIPNLGQGWIWNVRHARRHLRSHR